MKKRIAEKIYGKPTHSRPNVPLSELLGRYADHVWRKALHTYWVRKLRQERREARRGSSK